MQEVLHVQRIDAVLRVIRDHLVRNQQRLVGIGGTETEKGETTRQTSDGTKERLERLGHVVGDKVLIDLHHRDDGLLGVGKRCLTADTEYLLVVNHATSDDERKIKCKR